MCPNLGHIAPRATRNAVIHATRFVASSGLTRANRVQRPARVQCLMQPPALLAIGLRPAWSRLSGPAQVRLRIGNSGDNRGGDR